MLRRRKKMPLLSAAITWISISNFSQIHSARFRRMNIILWRRKAENKKRVLFLIKKKERGYAVTQKFCFRSFGRILSWARVLFRILCSIFCG